MVYRKKYFAKPVIQKRWWSFNLSLGSWKKQEICIKRKKPYAQMLCCNDNMVFIKLFDNFERFYVINRKCYSYENDRCN